MIINFILFYLVLNLYQTFSDKQITTVAQAVIMSPDKSTIKTLSVKNDNSSGKLKRSKLRDFLEMEFDPPVEDEREAKKTVEKREEHTGPKIWDHWGKWTSCSTTCGIGRQTRWRHCVSGGCASGEKEAQIKRCTLPAC